MEAAERKAEVAGVPTNINTFRTELSQQLDQTDQNVMELNMTLQDQGKENLKNFEDIGKMLRLIGRQTSNISISQEDNGTINKIRAISQYTPSKTVRKQESQSNTKHTTLKKKKTNDEQVIVLPMNKVNKFIDGFQLRSRSRSRPKASSAGHQYFRNESINESMDKYDSQDMSAEEDDEF